MKTLNKIIKLVKENKPLSILFFLLIVFSAYLRLHNLESFPQAFFTDEAALGYNSWSLATTLKDEYGKLLPLTLRSFDDYKPAIYSYLSIPFISIFGLTQASSRMVAAISGTILVALLFFLILKLTKNKYLALLSSLILSISPWHIEISRTAIEAGVAVMLTIASITIQKKNSKYRNFFSILLLILSLWTYHSARLISPLLLVSAILFNVIKASKKYTITVILIFIIGLLLSITSSQSRFSQIGIFNDFEAKLIRDEGIREDGGAIDTTILETRVAHNKVDSIIQSFSKSYIKNTSFEYLFIGGAQPPRVTIPETGQFLLILLPFFIFGMGMAAKNINKPINKWLIFWIILAPVPAALTTAEIPSTYRTVFLLPVVSIFIAYGLLSMIKLLNGHSKKLAQFSFIIVSILIGVNFNKSMHQYRVHQQVHQPWHRQYGYQNLITYLNNVDDLETVTITNRENEPYMMYLFYNKISPKTYHAQPEKRLGHKEINLGKETWTLFNYTFTESECPSNAKDTNPNNYYVGVGTCEIPEMFEKVYTINFLDDNPEFQIYHPSVIEE